MTRLLQILTIAGFSCFTMSAVSAQTKNAPKNQLGEFDEIVIKHKSNKDGKVTVEIKNGDILINGKKMDDYNDPDLSVFRRKITPKDGNALSFDSNNFPGGSFDLFNDNEGNDDEEMDVPIVPNKAVLGVITEKVAASGVTVKSVAKGTPAEKAGIKTGDIITSVDDKKINEPAELFEVIGKHQPADKVTVTYIRNSKTNKVAVTLDERKEMDNSWNNLPPSALPKNAPRSFSFPMPRGGQGFGNGWYNHMDNGVKLGLQVQDAENEAGALVTAIDPTSPAAAAGFQKEDIVLEFAGTPVKNVADLSKAYRENRDKGDVQAKVNRNGSTQTVNIKLPRKVNKANI